MTYQISINGQADSKKGEAEALEAVADLLEDIGALGSFSFSGEHFTVQAGPQDDAAAAVRDALEGYAAEADADDQVDAD
jgi:hypothetical protein